MWLTDIIIRKNYEGLYEQGFICIYHHLTFGALQLQAACTTSEFRPSLGVVRLLPESVASAVAYAM
jgi:hypothetical protein